MSAFFAPVVLLLITLWIMLVLVTLYAAWPLIAVAIITTSYLRWRRSYVDCKQRHNVV